MKILKEKISFLEAKSLQSFLESHSIQSYLSSEHSLDILIAENVSVLVDEEDYNQALRLLSELESDS